MRAAVVVCLALAAAGARADELDELAEREPTVEELRAAAARHAGLDPERPRRFGRRVRLAALLPRVTLRAARRYARDQGLTLDVEEEAGGADRLKLSTGDDLVLEARATWDLSRLVWDSAELSTAREAVRLAAERADLDAEVTRLFHQRRRLQAEWALAPPEDPVDAAMRRLEIEEVTDALDALTGGYLKRELGE